MKYVVGIDVSKSFVDIAYQISGKEFTCKHIDSNGAKTAAIILRELNCNPSAIQVVMESTGSYHVALATRLYELGCQVCVENPLSIKRFSQMKLSRAKTDSYDARLIAEYGMTQELRSWQPPSKTQEELRQGLKALEDLHQLRNEIGNRLEALERYPQQNQVVVAIWKEQLAQLKEQVCKLKIETEKLSKLTNCEAYSQLQTIPGIGPMVASALLGQFGGFQEFERAAQLVASVGLNPAPYQSGTSVRGKGGISKRGHSYIRKLLYMAAMTAKASNPFCKAMFDRLVEKGVCKRKALVAVAHKLLRQAFGVVKSKKDFDPHFSKTFAQEA